jgi:hypothetical protein
MNGTPIGRSWIVMMRNGVTAIDWGGGQFQDTISGDFFMAVESDVSHRAGNVDLDLLSRIGRVDGYDEVNVYFVGLPELPFKTTL